MGGFEARLLSLAVATMRKYSRRDNGYGTDAQATGIIGYGELDTSSWCTRLRSKTQNKQNEYKSYALIRDYSVTGIPAANPRSPPTDPLMKLILFSFLIDLNRIPEKKPPNFYSALRGRPLTVLIVLYWYSKDTLGKG